jgi:hypothetical protein
VIALGLGFLGIANSTDAYARRTRVVVTPVFYWQSYGGWYGHGWYRYEYSYNPWAHFSAVRYVECRNKVIPERFSSPALVFMIDACYLGQPW